MSFYDYEIITPKNEKISLQKYAGKVVLVVNTATGCGFTPQYEKLQKLYDKFHEQGLEIIDIPCNQFYGQAPGSDDEIHEFCTLHYNTKFPQMKKSDVNGANALPLFTFLKAEKGFTGFGESKEAEDFARFIKSVFDDYEETDDIKWNFTKFVIDRNGRVRARFEPIIDMQELEEYIEAII